MVAVPTSPVFSQDETPSIAKLNQLTSAVAFVTQLPVVCSLKASGVATSFAARSNTVVNWGTKEFDSDGMYNSATPSLLTVQTPGYYKIHCVVASQITGNNDYEVSVHQTYGNNNPNGAAGTIVVCLTSTSGSSANTADFTSLNVSGLTPYMYAGDTISVFIFCSAAGNVAGGFGFTGNLDNAGFSDGASAFQCYLASTGP